MVSSLKALAGGPVAAADLFRALAAGAAGATFPLNFLKNSTEYATEYSVYTSPRPVTKRILTTYMSFHSETFNLKKNIGAIAVYIGQDSESATEEIKQIIIFGENKCKDQID